MADVKLTADLNQAIEQLATKLGMAATEIIPHYTRLERVYGIAWCTGGALLSIIPWALFFIQPEGWEQPATGLWWAARIIFCTCTTWAGIYTIMMNS